MLFVAVFKQTYQTKTSIDKISVEVCCCTNFKSCDHIVGKLLHVDCVHTMPADFENDEKCDGSKIWASVHTMPEQFENGQKFAGK